MVEGVNSPVRSFLSVGGNPLVMERGQGAKIFDADGNAYTDYCLSWGALILGHNHPAVQKVVKKQAAKGSSFGTTTKPEIEIARFITKHIPSIDLVRFVNSGTEATMSAIRLARGFTKRKMIVKFDGCYHGHFDDLLIKAGSGVANLKESSSLGITKGHVENTLSLPYNNTAVLSEALERHKSDIACVIVEPVAGNIGTVVPNREFLVALRDLTKKHGIVLIFDEIMTGFRTNIGCVQSDFGIIPDITCLGKIIGGGFPVGAYGGRRDIMENLAPKGGVYQAGTFSGNPLVMAAGLAALSGLTKSFYKGLNEKSEQFIMAMNAFFEDEDLDVSVSGYKSMMSIRFQRRQIKDYADAVEASSRKRYSRLFHFLFKKGIYWPPAELETFFISGAHTTGDLTRLFTALKEFFVKEK